MSVESRRLPWWTWLVPGLVAHLGTQLSLACAIAPGISAIYLPIPLGLVMAFWWGPRVLPGVYVNAVLSAGLWDLPNWSLWPLYALPETLAVGLGWWLFTRVGHGRVWLPQRADVVELILLAVVPAAACNAFLVAGQLVLLGDLPAERFWSLAWAGGIATMLDGLAIAAPLAMLVTPLLERRHLWLGAGAPRDPLAELRGLGTPGILEILVAFGAFFFVSRVAPLERYWFVYGVFVLWAALRRGAVLAVLANLWLHLLTMLLPALEAGELSSSPELQSIQMGLVILCLMGLVVGRTMSDQRETIRRREEAERALAEKESSLRMLVREQPELIVRWRPDGTRTFVNGAYCRYFGVREEDCVGTSFMPLVSPEFRETLRHKIASLTPDSPEATSEHRSFVPGGLRWQQWTDRGLFDRDGTLVELISTGRDVTERRLAEDALALVASRYRAIFEASLDGIIVMDAGGRVLEWNPAAEAIFGHRREAVIGESVADAIVPPPSRERHNAALARYVATRESRLIGRRVEMEAMRADGSRIEVELAISVIQGAEPPIFAAVVRDISQRRTLEEQLRQAQKMEAIGRLAGGVAHDFNNLLTVIIGYSEHLLEVLDTGGDERELLDEILQAGRRSARLTGQLLAFSRQQVLSPVLLDLNEVVRDVERMLRRVLGEHIALEVMLAPSLAPIRADRGQIEQVLLNLAINARDAMPQGGTLTIATAHLTGDATGSEPGGAADAANGWVTLTMRDTGDGIPEEARARIFEPFFTTKEIGRGTGLGLSVVHGVVEQSGGHIEVESAPGAGTCFRVFLPSVSGTLPESAAREVRPVTTDAPGVGHVLLVEDADAVRTLASRTLSARGYTVTSARDGEEALDLLTIAEQRFDLLVTDIVMPGVSGRVVAERFGERFPEAKVLYMSGYTSDEVIRHGVEHERASFLQKPFSPEELAHKVREVLG